jgi:hypothetical protein
VSELANCNEEREYPDDDASGRHDQKLDLALALESSAASHANRDVPSDEQGFGRTKPEAREVVLRSEQPSSVVHTCSCGAQYDAAGWAALPLLGYQASEDPDELCELRNCSCTSTRAVRVPGPGFWIALAQVRLVEARTEAQAEKYALAQSYLDRAVTCMTQANELHKMLNAQKTRTAQNFAQAAE